MSYELCITGFHHIQEKAETCGAAFKNQDFGGKYCMVLFTVYALVNYVLYTYM